MAELRLQTVRRSGASLAEAPRVLPQDVARDLAMVWVGLLSARALRASRLPPRLVPASTGHHLPEPCPEPGLLASSSVWLQEQP